MKKLIFLLIILALLGGGYYAYTQGYFNQWINKEVPKDADGNRIFSDEEISQYEEYLKQGHEYIVAGDAGDKSAYEKAVEVYKKASAIGDDKFWNPLLGLASAYRKLDKFSEADKAYDKALVASKYGEGKIYQEKIEMYRYDLKVPNDEVRKIYDEAIVKVTDNANLVLSYAVFLRDIGDYAGALKYYTLISEKFPENDLYKKEIESLKVKIGE